MDLDLTPEQRLVRDTVRGYARNTLEKRGREMDRRHEFPAKALQELRALGLMGALVPTEYGGAALDKVSYCLALEELAWADASTCVTVAVHTSVATHPVMWFGSDHLKRTYLPKLAAGELFGCFAVTEPQSGSDIAGIATTSRREGDHYVLRGEKTFITNASHADFAIVAAKTAPEKGHRGVSLFAVETAWKGVSAGEPEQKMGLRASDTGSLAFRDVRVPKANLIGAENDGFRMLMRVLNSSRVGIGAQATGIAQRALDEALWYAKDRHAFGVPIGAFQGLQWMLADVAVGIEAARLLTFNAATHEDQGTLGPAEASVCKVFASELATRAANAAVQVFGGSGYVTDYPVERLLRDARVTEIYEGTSEIQRMIVARSVLGALDRSA